jgi:hypothetical protein
MTVKVEDVRRATIALFIRETWDAMGKEILLKSENADEVQEAFLKVVCPKMDALFQSEAFRNFYEGGREVEKAKAIWMNNLMEEVSDVVHLETRVQAVRRSRRCAIL